MKGKSGLNTSVRDELLGMDISDAAHELGGFLSAALISSDESSTYASTARLSMMRRVLALLKHLKMELFNAKMTSHDGGEDMPDTTESYSLCQHCGRTAFKLQTSLYSSILESSTFVPGDRECWAWMRGVWGTVGSIYLPQNGYCMYMRFIDARKTAELASDILRHAGTSPTVRKNGRGVEVMLRHQEHIVTVLIMMGLTRSALALEETAIMRSLRNKANKIVNCDSANIEKTVSAAREQMKLVERVERGDMWSALPARLAELIRLRLSNPSASLRELGQMLSRPVSKSAVEYRWKKIASIVERYEQDKIR